MGGRGPCCSSEETRGSLAGWGLCAPHRTASARGPASRRLLPFVSLFRPLPKCLRTEEETGPPKAAGFRVLRGVQVAFNRRTWGPTAPSHVSQRTAVRAATRGFRGFKHGTRTTHRLETKQDRPPICCVFRAMLPVCTPYARRRRHHEVLDGGVCFEWRPRRRRFVPVRSGRRGW